MRGSNRMRNRVKISQVSRLEEATTDFYALLQSASEAMEYLHDKKDPTREESELLTVKMAIDQALVAVPQVTKLLILAPVVNAVRWANELSIADNACVLGRDGCERRWDRTMAMMRKALARLEFDEDSPMVICTCDTPPSGRRVCDTCGRKGDDVDREYQDEGAE